MLPNSHKKKHDTIEGVWTDHDSKRLIDCSQVEAECFNAGYKEAQRVFKRIARLRDKPLFIILDGKVKQIPMATSIELLKALKEDK